MNLPSYSEIFRKLQLSKESKIVFPFLFVIALLGLMQIFLWSAPSNFKSNVFVEIPAGSTISESATILHDAQVLRSPFWFKVLNLLFYKNTNIKAGDYLFKDPVSVTNVAKRLANGTFGLSLSKVTIPEGYTKTQIADLFVTKFPLFDKNAFIQSAPEGYLFPDTYFFFEDVKAKAVSGRMQDVFNTKTAPLKAEAATLGKNFANVVIIASILEEEVKTLEDMKLVSGILYKRLSISMPLQVDSASTTYQQKGLPSTPISNPGLQALDAALHPTNTDYLYYLSDRAGKIYYAKTFEDHQTNRENHLGK